MSDLEDELTPEMLAFLDELVGTGKYRDRGDALRELLRAVMEGVAEARTSRSKSPAAFVGSKGAVVQDDNGGNVTIQLKTF